MEPILQIRTGGSGIVSVLPKVFQMVSGLLDLKSHCILPRHNAIRIHAALELGSSFKISYVTKKALAQRPTMHEATERTRMGMS